MFKFIYWFHSEVDSLKIVLFSAILEKPRLWDNKNKHKKEKEKPVYSNNYIEILFWLHCFAILLRKDNYTLLLNYIYMLGWKRNEAKYKLSATVKFNWGNPVFNWFLNITITHMLNISKKAIFLNLTLLCGTTLLDFI